MRSLLLLAALLTACSGPGASVTPAQEAVEDRLGALLASASAPGAGPDTLAPFLVARGDDVARRWKAPADLTQPSERVFVEDVASRLDRFLQRARRPDGTLEYEIEAFTTESESEGVWHVLEVEFEGADNEVDALFAFLPIGGTYYLGEFES